MSVGELGIYDIILTPPPPPPPPPLPPIPSFTLFPILLTSLQLYAHTHDDHFELVVVDYDSQDMNVESIMKNSALKR